MVKLGGGVGKRVAHVLVVIQQVYDISTTSVQSCVVQIIVVELHYAILIIGWYFSVENVRIPMVDVYYAPRTRVAVCFDGGSCSPIYKEVLC